jgi:class 3 adenylate cyclase
VCAGYTLVLYYIQAHPDVSPFIDRAMLPTMIALLTIIIAGALGFVLAGLVSRKRWPDGRLVAYAWLHFYMACMAIASYTLGHYTDLLGAMALFSGAAVACIFLDPRIVRSSLFTFVAILVATTIAEQMGVLPYAPVFATPPIEAGHLASSWLLTGGGFSFLILVAVIFFFVEVTRVARDRDQRLRRSNALIRRYVPAQLAEKILAGEHTGTGRPERRRLTLFFSDVVEFTQAADRMEAEDLSALLNEYLAEMATIAEEAGATVNQFVGDGIMIFFGAPEATSDRDHALRAVRMALAMQRRMDEMRQQWFEGGIETPFRIRIGINTGVASVGDFGSEGRTTYSAIGNQTNLTARIQDRCEPGRVLISHTTWALVHDEIPCKERGEIEVKGLHYPIKVYEVTDTTVAASRP